MAANSMYYIFTQLHFTASSNMRQAWAGMTPLMRTPNFIEIFLTFPEMWTSIFQKPAAAAILFLKIAYFKIWKRRELSQ